MSKHLFGRRGPAKAFLFFMVGVIGVGAEPADRDPLEGGAVVINVDCGNARSHTVRRVCPAIFPSITCGGR